VAAWANAEVVEQLHADVRRMTLHADHLEWAARLVLRLEGHAVVVSPPALDARVRALAAAALQRYDAAPPHVDDT
jgi:predicted DNA-binding transcriptional regulator YafY